MTTTTARKSCPKCHAVMTSKCPNVRCESGPTLDYTDTVLARLNGIGTEYIVSLHPNDHYSLMVASGPVCNMIADDFTTFGGAVVAAAALIEGRALSRARPPSSPGCRPAAG